MTVFDATVKDYLTEIDESPLLSWQQECELAGRVMDSDDPEARDILVRSNLRLVVNIAKKYATGKMALADLIEEGNLGLIRAVDSFDPSIGVRFSTYASWWIKQSIKRALLLDAGPISVPTYMVELVNQYRHTVAELQGRFPDNPTMEQIAKEMKLPVKKVIAIAEVADSTNNNLTGESETVVYDHVDTSGTICNDLPEDALVSAEEMQKVVKMLDRLGSRESQILRLRFGIGISEPLTLKQIGAKLNLTRERVRQLQLVALQQLNEIMNG